MLVMNSAFEGDVLHSSRLSAVRRYSLTVTLSGPGQSVIVSKNVLPATLWGNVGLAISVIGY